LLIIPIAKVKTAAKMRAQVKNPEINKVALPVKKYDSNLFEDLQNNAWENTRKGTMETSIKINTSSKMHCAAPLSLYT